MIDDFLNINTFLLFLILLFVIYLTFKKREDSEGDSDEALVDISNSLNKLEDIERKISINAESIAKVDERIIKSEAPLQQLNRFLSGSSTAGRVGEWGLSALIKDVFPQNSNLYEENREMVQGSGQRVEFAIKMPGEERYMPIDSKFASQMFSNYLEAQESGDKNSLDRATKELRQSLIRDAKDIREKYIGSNTTNEGIMFIPSESLVNVVYSLEEVREKIYRDHDIIVMGPSNLIAYLGNLKHSHNAIALQENILQVKTHLENFKYEFEKFSNAYDSAKKKSNLANKSIEEFQTRINVMQSTVNKMGDKLEEDSKET